MDIVEMAADALADLSDEGITVQQGWYDENIRDLHVTIWNLGNYEGGFSDDGAEMEVAIVQICIWSDRDQVQLKKRIKKLMKQKEFLYLGDNDNLETDTGIFMNAARFMAAEEIEQEEEEE